MEKNVLAGLDVGSGRITVAVGAAEADKPGVAVLAGASVPCAGVQGGQVTDIRAASASIRAAIEESEKTAGVGVSGVRIGVRGEHVRGSSSRGRRVVARPDREITEADVEAAVQAAEAAAVTEGRALLHLIPRGFTLDGGRPSTDPVGMTASLLDMDAHVVTADAAALDALEKAVADAGVEPVEAVYGLLAAAELVLTPTERELGCLLLDLGGQTTSFGFFYRDSMLLSRELAAGSDALTEDIAYALHIERGAAERLKLAHGLRDAPVLWRDEDAPRLRSDGKARAPRKSNLRRLMAPKVKRVVAEVSTSVLAAGLGRPIHGAVLTGGGALLKGLDREVGRLLDTDARIGVAQGHPRLGAVAAELLSPRYVTAVGLLLNPSGRWATAPAAVAPSLIPWDNPWLARLKALWADVF